MIDLSKMSTEQSNPDSVQFSSMSIEQAVELMNSEDFHAVEAVKAAIPEIVSVIRLASQALVSGGRIIYCGAGTSGRLGVLDAVECPPTFGVDYNTVVGLIAGGDSAFVKAKEGAEDSEELGKEALEEISVTDRDMVIGVAASGRTPYVIGALKYAMEIGASTGAVVCNANSAIEALCKNTIVLLPGPEVLTGSTRLKAGTATKMVLNMISTISMVRIGKVYKNYMVDVKMTNKKLEQRGLNIVCTLTGADPDRAAKALAESGNHVKTAIVMIEQGVSADEAKALLEKAKGHISSIVG